MSFNEDSRVKIPALLHFTRLGYEYVSLKGAKWDEGSNIFTDIFSQAVKAINSDPNPDEIERSLKDISLLLDNEDLGRGFYQRLLNQTGLKLIDFENFDKNSFHVVTELPCRNDDEEFRPDITLLINGMPLVFIEVKKPNNREGILAEHNRIKTRFQNDKFKRFFNITQLMVFSNNMEYDDHSPEPLEGAFYATPALKSPAFNYFREERHDELPPLAEASPATEDFILRDTNKLSIKHTPEYATNKSPDSPTNRLSTSLFCRERLAFLLRYGIAYVRAERGFEKHVMRYPQIFATKAISDQERKLCDALNAFKVQADEAISQNSQLLKNEDYAERELLKLAITQFNKNHDFGFDTTSLKDINKTILKEYLDEASGKVPA